MTYKNCKNCGAKAWALFIDKKTKKHSCPECDKQYLKTEKEDIPTKIKNSRRKTKNFI